MAEETTAKEKRPRKKRPAPPLPKPEENLLTIKQMAEKLQCSTSVLYRLVEWGLVPCRRMGRSGRMIRFDPMDKDAIASKVPKRVATPKETNA